MSGQNARPGACARCGARLRRDNRSDTCDPCARAQVDRRLSHRPDLPADFYERPVVVDALRRYDFGPVFLEARREAGFTQEDFGAFVGLSQPKVCRIERDQMVLRDVEAVSRVAAALRIPPELIGFCPPARVVEEEDADQVEAWLRRRDMLSTIVTLALGSGLPDTIHARLTGLLPDVDDSPPGRIGHPDVERFEATTQAFRISDQQCGGGLARAAAIAQLRSLIETHRATCTLEVRSRLLLATTDLASLAAWMTYDVEQHDAARRLWMVALDAAREADSPDTPQVVGNTLRQLAHQALHLRRPQEARQLVRLATSILGDGAGEPSPRMLAMLTAYEGWSYAMEGKAQACQRSLGRAADIFSDAEDEAPDWLRHFDAAELTGLSGHIYHVLAEFHPSAANRAEPLLREAIDQRETCYVRSRALNLVGLTGTYFQQGEIEAAVSLGHQAADAVITLRSPRTLRRIRALHRIARTHASRPAVAELTARLAVTAAHA